MNIGPSKPTDPSKATEQYSKIPGKPESRYQRLPPEAGKEAINVTRKIYQSMLEGGNISEAMKWAGNLDPIHLSKGEAARFLRKCITAKEKSYGKISFNRWLSNHFGNLKKAHKLGDELASEGKEVLDEKGRDLQQYLRQNNIFMRSFRPGYSPEHGEYLNIYFVNREAYVEGKAFWFKTGDAEHLRADDDSEVITYFITPRQE